MVFKGLAQDNEYIFDFFFISVVQPQQEMGTRVVQTGMAMVILMRNLIVRVNIAKL